MTLLNNGEMDRIVGGESNGSPCEKTGDTIFQKCFWKVVDVKFIQCYTFEVTCSSGFSFDDKGASCGSGFAIVQK